MIFLGVENFIIMEIKKGKTSFTAHDLKKKIKQSTGFAVTQQS